MTTGPDSNPDTGGDPGIAPAPPSFRAARAMLAAQAVVSTLGVGLAYLLLLAFSAMAGSTTAEIHTLTLVVILVGAIPVVVHVLAAVNLGVTGRGSVYLVLSFIASGVQVVAALLVAGAYGLCLVALVLAFAAGTAFGALDEERRDYLRSIHEEGGRPLRDLIVFAAVVALSVSLVMVNDRVNDVENRHSTRDFDYRESDERLASALDPLLAALAEVEGFPEPLSDRSESDMCNDGAGWDPQYSDYQHFYYFEDREAEEFLSPEAGPGREAIEAVRAELSGDGWDITQDRVRFNDLHMIAADRDDGVRVWFELGAGSTQLWATTGCIKNGEDPA